MRQGNCSINKKRVRQYRSCQNRTVGLTQVAGSAAPDSGNIYSGETRARHGMQLGFRIGGKIIAHLKGAGARVRAGQVLARGPPLWEAAMASEQAGNDPQWNMSARPVAKMLSRVA